MNDMFSSLGLDRQATSARHMNDLMQTMQRQLEIARVGRKGAEAQIESSKILADQREEIELMRKSITSLLKHSLEQAQLQSIAAKQRDKIESERYHESIRWTKIAAWSGVGGFLLGLVALALQIVF